MDERCIEGLDHLPDAVRRGVLTIGNFDGVHLGHRRILETARGIAEAEGLAAVAMTFEPPPERILHPDSEPQRILPAGRKLCLLLEAGADYVVIAHTDETLLRMSPEEFIERIIVETFQPRHVVEGRNFFFGLARSGGVDALRQAGDVHAFVVKVVEPVRVELPEGANRISSTLVRRLLGEGRVEQAAQCLGRTFALFGKVIAGAGKGRVLEFPTANLDCGEQIIPADGVYAGKARLGSGVFPAAISIGTKPTFGPADRAVEAFLIDAEGDYYGEEMELEFLEHLRGQARFEDTDVLRRHISEDVKRVREICG